MYEYILCKNYGKVENQGHFLCAFESHSQVVEGVRGGGGVLPPLPFALKLYLLFIFLYFEIMPPPTPPPP